MGKFIDVYQYKRKIVDFLDDNLTEKAKADFLQEVEGNSTLLGIFENEKNVRSYIKSHVIRPKISPDFIKSITDKIKIDLPRGIV